MIKEALKRRNPGFSEQYYGFRTFGNLLEEAQGRGLLELGRDEKSGLFVFRGSGVVTTRPEASSPPPLQDSYTRAEAMANAQDTQARPSANEARDDDTGATQDAGEAPDTMGGDMTDRPRSGRGRQRGGRKSASQRASMSANAAPTGHNDSMADEHVALQNDTNDTADMPSAEATPAAKTADRGGRSGSRTTTGRTGSRSSGGGANARAGTRGGNKTAEAAPASPAPVAATEVEAPARAATESSAAEATAEPAGKSAPRNRRPRKPAAKKTTAV